MKTGDGTKLYLINGGNLLGFEKLKDLIKMED